MRHVGMGLALQGQGEVAFSHRYSSLIVISILVLHALQCLAVDGECIALAQAYEFFVWDGVEGRIDAGMRYALNMLYRVFGRQFHQAIVHDPAARARRRAACQG